MRRNDGSERGQAAHGARALIAALLVAAAMLAVAAGSAGAATITGPGPVTSLTVSPDLTCSATYRDDPTPVYAGATACGTFVSVDGTLYGPADVTGADAASPRTAWTPVSQVTAGRGTFSNPYSITTTVTGGSAIRLQETDGFTTGQEWYGTGYQITNLTDVEQQVTIYHAANCLTAGDDQGYATIDRPARSVTCTTGDRHSERIERWEPTTGNTSHAYESTPANVWAAISAQQPFPDTCDCATHEDNAAGLSYTITVPPHEIRQLSHRIVLSTLVDTDHDALPDIWESPDGGIDWNDDGTIDLKLSDLGARPDQRDIFIQVVPTRTPTRCLLWWCSTSVVHRPTLAALGRVQKGFGGGYLHFDIGPDGPLGSGTWGLRSRVGEPVELAETIPGAGGGTFDWNAAFNRLRATVLPPERRRVFHLALYVGRIDAAGTTELVDGTPGRDFIIATDVFPDGGPTRSQEAGTFLHALGHILGLTHGGAADEAGPAYDYKPSYPSVMNHLWQLTGTIKGSPPGVGLLELSSGTEAALDESALVERAGSGLLARRWRCPDGSLHPLVGTYSNGVDWNCNGSIDADPVSVDVNGSGALEVLRDHADHASLVLDGGGTIGGHGLDRPAATTPIDEPPVRDLLRVQGDQHAISLSTLDAVRMQARTTARLIVTIRNNHDAAHTFKLAQTLGGGLTLRGLPAKLDLAAGETRDLPLIVGAPTAPGHGVIEIDASFTGEPNAARSTTTDVTVVAGAVPDQPPASGGPYPLADTESPVEVTTSTATLRGLASGNGAAVTACRFEYGSGGAIRSSIPCDSEPPSRGPATRVTAHLTGLHSGTPYAYELVVATRNGTVRGGSAVATTGVSGPEATAALRRALASSCPASHLRALLRTTGSCPTPFIPPGSGTAEFRWTTRRRVVVHGRRVIRTVLVAAGRRDYGMPTAPARRIRVAFTKAGKRVIRNGRGPLRITIRGSFTDGTGTRFTASRVVSFRR